MSSLGLWSEEVSGGSFPWGGAEGDQVLERGGRTLGVSRYPESLLCVSLPLPLILAQHTPTGIRLIFLSLDK